MFDLFYNFLHDFLFNSSVIDENLQNNACIILTCVIMVLIVFLLIKLIVWVFNIMGKNQRMRRF